MGESNMSKKRFIRIKNENGVSIKDTKTGYERYYAIEVLDDLNELAEENEQLKKKIESLQKILHIVEVMDENWGDE